MVCQSYKLFHAMRTDTAFMIWALIILTVSYSEMLTTTKSYDFLIGIIHNLKM